MEIRGCKININNMEIDWNNKNIEDYIEHLEEKFRYNSSSVAKAVFELIVAYREKSNVVQSVKCADCGNEMQQKYVCQTKGCLNYNPH